MSEGSTKGERRVVKLSVLSSMWSDQRGSEVLEPPECRRLLALAAKQRPVGRIGISHSGAPMVLPVNFSYADRYVVVRLGRGGMLDNALGSLVAFEVDDVDYEERLGWSVLVRGLAEQLGEKQLAGVLALPRPLVSTPGVVLVGIRLDVVTGRRFAF
ncbi:MAG: pyridoxamine 5'-phosphate oxidase family protein [Acidimicrobiales bacterium]